MMKKMRGNQKFKLQTHSTFFRILMTSNLFKIIFLVVFLNMILIDNWKTSSFFFFCEKKKTICESKKSQIAKAYLAKFSQSLHSRKFIWRTFFDFPIRENLSRKFREFFGSRKFVQQKFLRLKQLINHQHQLLWIHLRQHRLGHCFLYPHHLLNIYKEQIPLPLAKCESNKGFLSQNHAEKLLPKYL